MHPFKIYEIVVDETSNSPQKENVTRVNVSSSSSSSDLKKFCSIRALSDIDRPLNDYRLFNTLESIALYDAHVRIWKEMVEKNVKHALVIDSSCAEIDLEKINSLPFVDGDVFLLDYDVLPDTYIEKTTNPGWKRLRNIFHGLNGYVISNQGARFLLRYAYPIEMRIDSLVGTLANLYSDEFKVYAQKKQRGNKTETEKETGTGNKTGTGTGIGNKTGNKKRIVHLKNSILEVPFKHNHPRHTRPTRPMSNVPMFLFTVLFFGIFLLVITLIMQKGNNRIE